MRRVLLLIGIVMMAPSFAGCDIPTLIMSTSDVEESAVSHYDAAQYEKALSYCNVLCKRRPDDYEAFSLRCYIHIELKNYEQAVEDACYAFDRYPDKLDSLKMRSYAYSMNNMYEEAIVDLKAVIAKSPSSAANLIDLGYMHEQLLQYQNAIDCYRQALEIDKESAWAWNNFSSVLSMALDPAFRNGKRAKAYAAKAVKLADDDEIKCYAWGTFGNALAELGDFDHAIKAAQRSLTFTSDLELVDEIETAIALYKKGEVFRYEAKQPTTSETQSVASTR